MSCLPSGPAGRRLGCPCDVIPTTIASHSPPSSSTGDISLVSQAFFGSSAFVSLLYLFKPLVHGNVRRTFCIHFVLSICTVSTRFARTSDMSMVRPVYNSRLALNCPTNRGFESVNPLLPVLRIQGHVTGLMRLVRPPKQPLSNTYIFECCVV